MDARFLLLLALAITACTADVAMKEIRGNFLCASNYLKAKGLLDSKFRVKSGEPDHPHSSCEGFISTFKNNYYENITKKFQKDKDLAEIADCLLEKAKEVELADLALKVVVYDGAINMPKRKRKKAMETIELAIEKKIETLAKVCAANNAFGDLYDQICKNETDSQNSVEDTPSDDYCIRKYLTENNFINTTIHQLDLNPEKIDLRGVDCGKLIASAKAETIAEMLKKFEEEDEFASRHAKKCLLKSLSDSRYFEAVGKAVALCGVTMAPEIEEYERDQFIKDMGSLYEVIYRC